MLGEPIPGTIALDLGIATHIVPAERLAETAGELARQLANGPTRAGAAIRTLLKAWPAGGVGAADLVMLDAAMELYDGHDVQLGLENTAKAFDADIEPLPMVFEGR